MPWSRAVTSTSCPLASSAALKGARYWTCGGFSISIQLFTVGRASPSSTVEVRAPYLYLRLRRDGSAAARRSALARLRRRPSALDAVSRPGVGSAARAYLQARRLGVRRTGCVRCRAVGPSRAGAPSATGTCSSVRVVAVHRCARSARRPERRSGSRGAARGNASATRGHPGRASCVRFRERNSRTPPPFCTSFRSRRTQMPSQPTSRSAHAATSGSQSGVASSCVAQHAKAI